MTLSFLKIHVAAAFFLLAALHHTCSVQGASLWQSKPRGSGAESSHGRPYLVPSIDMVKALEYIESLRQQTRGDDWPATDYSDLERFRSLPLATASEPEEPSQDAAASWQDDQSQQWLKVLLKTLQQSGNEPKATTALTSPRQAYGDRPRPEDDTDDRPAADEGDYEGAPWSERQKLPKKYPLMFEDEDSRESPYKRTNENVEEQYTPQSLATLQSVFEELGKMSGPKTNKRHSMDDELRLYRGDDDDDIYRVNNMAYEDVTGGEDWTPVEEKVETEEEVKGSREEFDRGSDENDGNSMKRSSMSGKYDEQEEPDDVTKLVDYYLLKILEKTEQTENKRDRVEEQNPFSYNINPQAIYRLIDISRKLQIPPEDLIDMLKNGEIKTQDKRPEAEEYADLDRAEERLAQIASSHKDMTPTAKFYGRKKPEILPNDFPDDLNTEDILKILGLESLANQKAKYLLKQKHSKNTPPGLYSPSGRQGDFVGPELSSISDKRKSDYDDAIEEELASHLAAKMLAQYPKMLKKMDLKRASRPASQEQQLAFDTLLQDYFDRITPDKGLPSKRLSEVDDVGDSTQEQGQDDDVLLKILEHMNPETTEKEDRDLYGRAIGGM
ncbi:secretogranin-2 [Brienomyrus brachyistius]|uniref:secretogranin-2 n=1 Tax=Brienomyrus brachyistius TaxID=42636 RepID=UPI0020B33F56|nr:secretogranin-2 [Brienomyrus brachyistius]XP_048838393.1 secretogranin-2 [Brienomyrus brachyistius]